MSQKPDTMESRLNGWGTVMIGLHGGILGVVDGAA